MLNNHQQCSILHALLLVRFDQPEWLQRIHTTETLRFVPIVRWREQIAAWHQAHVSNGPTEAVNNLIKHVKRVAFGFTKFAHYRIRALLYAGRPNWELLATITPR